MKGLLYKDLMTIRRTLLLYVVMILVFCVIDMGSMISIALIYCVMLPINVLAYDESARFDRYAPMLPLSDTVYVVSKYVTTWAAVALSMVCAAIGQLLTETITVVSVLPILACCLTAQAVILPLIFRLGVEKGRKVYVAALAILGGMAGALASVFEGVLLAVDMTLFGVLGLAASVALNAVSVWISQKMYVKRITA